MEKIALINVLPKVFSGKADSGSDIWLKKLDFVKGQKYLVEAVSGTGKSSLGSFMYGYRKDYDGSITFDGEDIKTFQPHRWVELRKHSLSILFQELRLFAELTAWENIKLKNDLTGYRTESEIGSWFDELGIADRKDQKIGKMSFGQQQRVAFIRALCQPADFLFMDEPVSHLDKQNGMIMARILEEEMHKNGMGVIVTSIGHQMEMCYDVVLKL